MPISAYSMMPRLREWKKDSAVGNAFSPRRRDDPVLKRIDALISTLWKTKEAGESQYLLGELFFSTMYWNNNHKRNPKMDSRRRGPIMSLNLFAANMLAYIHEVPIGTLAVTLREIYGTGLSEYGLGIDAREVNEGRYLSIAQREKYRVIFKKGKAWRFDCLTTSPDMRKPLVVADTNDYAGFAESAGSIDQRTDTGAGFVMSMSREFYVGAFISFGKKNRADRTKAPTFHSTFMAGKEVMAAGMIEIKNGIVTDIDNFSGHYKPVDASLVAVLEQLRLVGMDLQRIKVTTKVKQMVEETIVGQVYRQEKLVQVSALGDYFLKVNGNWDTLAKIKAETEGRRR